MLAARRACGIKNLCAVGIHQIGQGDGLGGGDAHIRLHQHYIKIVGLGDAVRFIGHVKARFGFSKGRLLVVPSRGDSMPYVVIEAAAAGVPMLGAKVGGIPEIFGPHTGGLFAANSPGAMADAIESALGDMEATRERARELRERVFAHFSQKAMVEGVLSGYREAFNAR